MTRRVLIQKLALAMMVIAAPPISGTREVLLRTRLPREMTPREFESAMSEFYRVEDLNAILSRYQMSGGLLSDHFAIRGRFAEWRLRFRSEADHTAWAKECERLFDRARMARAGYVHLGTEILS